MGRFLTCVLLGAGCGSVSSNDHKDAAVLPDMSVPGDAAHDASAPRCDKQKPFANAAPLPNLNSPSNEFAARLSRDELTIFFASNRAGGAGEYDIYTATRSSPTDMFGSPTRLVSLATSGTDTDPMPTADGLGLVFVRSPMGDVSGTDLYKATRTSTSGDFTTVTPLTTLNTTAEETSSYLAENDAVIYFTSTRAGGLGSYDIWRATRQNDGSYAQIENVAAANSSAVDAWPVASHDGLTLMFASNRGGGDIWQVTRPSPGGSFGTATHVAELETADSESPTWLSADDCVLYFQRNGTGGLGGYDIWSAVRPM